MAKKVGWLPSWVQTLGAIIDEGAKIQVFCQSCKVYRRFTQEDIIALAEKVGRDYSLIDRRCKCRLTPGCTGWNRFEYLYGVYRHLNTEEGRDRWLFNGEYSRGSIGS